MFTQALLELFEQSAGRRCMAAQRALSTFVSVNRRCAMHIVPLSYVDQFGKLRQRVDREKKRHERWLRLSLQSPRATHDKTS
jgi:hypothetical protein